MVTAEDRKRVLIRSDRCQRLNELPLCAGPRGKHMLYRASDDHGCCRHSRLVMAPTECGPPSPDKLLRGVLMRYYDQHHTLRRIVWCT